MKYLNLFFAQGEDAIEFVDILDKEGEKALMSYLDGAGVLDFDGEETDEAPWGEGDYLYDVVYDGGIYVISVDWGLPYIGITRRIR